MYLPSLTDKELVNHAHMTIDSLTTSDLERELIKRLENLLDEATADEATADERLTVLDDRGIDNADDLRAFFDNLDDVKRKVEGL